MAGATCIAIPGQCIAGQIVPPPPRTCDQSIATDECGGPFGAHSGLPETAGRAAKTHKVTLHANHPDHPEVLAAKAGDGISVAQFVVGSKCQFKTAAAQTEDPVWWEAALAKGGQFKADVHCPGRTDDVLSIYTSVAPGQDCEWQRRISVRFVDSPGLLLEISEEWDADSQPEFIGLHWSAKIIQGQEHHVIVNPTEFLSLIHISGPRDGLLSRMPSSA